MEMEAILETAMRELGEALGAKRARVRMQVVQKDGDDA
jgi:hypothetical protein